MSNLRLFGVGGLLGSVLCDLLHEYRQGILNSTDVHHRTIAVNFTGLIMSSLRLHGLELHVAVKRVQFYDPLLGGGSTGSTFGNKSKNLFR